MNWRPDENMYNFTQSTLNVPTSFVPNSQFHSVSLDLVQNMNQMYVCENVNPLKQKQNDEEFINNFVKIRVNKQSSVKSTSTLKIFEAKKYLINIILLKMELETSSKALDVNSQDFFAKWEEIIKKQNKINDLLLSFDNDSLHFLKYSVEKRRRRRFQDKKRKLKRRNTKEEMTESSRIKHALIDKLLGEKVREAESLKRVEALRRQADSVLHDVRRKKYEAKKMIYMLTAISSLRRIRSQQEVAQGGYCSKEIAETFNNVISQFQGLWKKQSEMYNLEEKGLKVMLEESEIPEMKISNIQKILNQWEQAFFGTPSSDDNYKLLTAADEDINSFLLVRRDWDEFITNYSTILSSCIPVGWILPSKNDNEEWNAFIRSNKRKC